MNIDIGALRMIEADKGIPIDTVITAIETALITAYRHTDGFAPHARIDVNRKTGEVRVMAQTLDEDGTVISEWDDTPEGFGRIAATTARQVILQRRGKLSGQRDDQAELLVQAGDQPQVGRTAPSQAGVGQGLRRRDLHPGRKPLLPGQSPDQER